ncbi:GNAT family N-acetyltransferase [Vibrio breoganii]
MRLFNENNSKEITEFVISNDSQFVPNLSSRVDLVQYVKKIMENGLWVGEKDNETIYSLLGGYINEDFAYISYLCVDIYHQKKGLATILMNEFVDICKRKGIKRINLTVREVSGAYKLYQSLSFKPVKQFKYKDSSIVGVEMTREVS